MPFANRIVPTNTAVRSKNTRLKPTAVKTITSISPMKGMRGSTSPAVEAWSRATRAKSRHQPTRSGQIGGPSTVPVSVATSRRPASTSCSGGVRPLGRSRTVITTFGPNSSTLSASSSASASTVPAMPRRLARPSPTTTDSAAGDSLLGGSGSSSATSDVTSSRFASFLTATTRKIVHAGITRIAATTRRMIPAPPVAPKPSIGGTTVKPMTMSAAPTTVSTSAIGAGSGFPARHRDGHRHGRGA